MDTSRSEKNKVKSNTTDPGVFGALGSNIAKKRIL